MEQNTNPKYPCSRCKAGSNYANDNSRDAQGKLVCTKCRRMAPTEIFTQFLNHRPPSVSLEKGEITVWYHTQTGRVHSAWINYGRAGTKAGNGKPFPGAIRAIEAQLESGLFPCSKCHTETPGEELKQAAMCGRLCANCFTKWELRCTTELRTGNVCSKCGAPRSRCCC